MKLQDILHEVVTDADNRRAADTMRTKMTGTAFPDEKVIAFIRKNIKNDNARAKIVALIQQEATRRAKSGGFYSTSSDHNKWSLAPMEGYVDFDIGMIVEAQEMDRKTAMKIVNDVAMQSMTSADEKKFSVVRLMFQWGSKTRRTTDPAKLKEFFSGLGINPSYIQRAFSQSGVSDPSPSPVSPGQDTSSGAQQRLTRQPAAPPPPSQQVQKSAKQKPKFSEALKTMKDKTFLALKKAVQNYETDPSAIWTQF